MNGLQIACGSFALQWQLCYDKYNREYKASNISYLSNNGKCLMNSILEAKIIREYGLTCWKVFFD